MIRPRWLCPMWPAVVTLLGPGALAVASGCHETCEIAEERIGPVRLRASKAEVLKQISNRYSVSEETKAGHAPMLIARVRGAQPSDQPAFAVMLDSDRVFLIDSYERCVTKEGIGPGITLGRAQEIYGTGRIEPTDLGYFVSFPAKQGVMFLLDKRDVPTALREIADDELSLEQEREILRLGKARILAARVAEP